MNITIAALIKPAHDPAGTSPVSQIAENIARTVKRAVMRRGITKRRYFNYKPPTRN